MCGIFGVIVRKDAGFSPAFVQRSLLTLARLSESRGKDSSGVVLRNEVQRELQVLKGAVPIRFLLKTSDFAHLLEAACRSWQTESGDSRTFAAIGHSRLVTNGSNSDDANNQPVVKDGIVGVHNGIIVNYEELWSKYPEIRRTSDIDTEVMLALIRRQLNDGWDVATAVAKTVLEIFGTVTAAFFLNDQATIALAANNGSLFTLVNEGGFFAFASEKYFLTQLALKLRVNRDERYRIQQVLPGHGITVDLVNVLATEFPFSVAARASTPPADATEQYRIVNHSVTNGSVQKELVLTASQIAIGGKSTKEASLLEFNQEKIQRLRRCHKCLLPTTFPFIVFDERGVCNYCTNYVIKNRPRPIDELLDLVKPYRRKDGGQDCIIPYSGGRDSTFSLHFAKNVLNLNPVAFTYEWGMVTDLARRNIARVCGKLGVENILVSANISWKRENIRRNILAWLHKPDLGMIPLFMAGDKFFFYYTDQVKRQTGIDLNIWGINPLENTDFKVGFLGVSPDHNKKRIYALSARRQLQLFRRIGTTVLRNPRYVNRSVWDTCGSFVSRSIIPHRDFYSLFDFVKWDEQEVEELVLDEYQWETAADTRTTWRIGDGTAAFYNYIYYTVAGFTEFDTFRSNQIREGMISREDGLRLVTTENRPRFPSIKWYTDILGLDFASTIKRINEIPKLYPSTVAEASRLARAA